VETKLMLTTAGSMLCLTDEHGTILGWIPFPSRRDAFGPQRETVYLARPTASPERTVSRAA
jgi:hypothetical protein